MADKKQYKRKGRKLKEYMPLIGKTMILGGLEYKIRYFKHLEPLDPEDEEHYDPNSWAGGWSDNYNRELALFAYMSKQEHDFTLIHEILHCAIEAIKTSEKFQDEDFIKPLSRFLLEGLKQCNLLKASRVSHKTNENS